VDDAVKLTLRDGTRTSVAGDDIADIEPDGRGALVHLVSGETLNATQDARTLEVRWRTATAVRPPAPVIVPDVDDLSEEPEETEVAEDPAEQAPPPSRVGRMKRMLLGRISQGAFMISDFERKSAKD
jgi:hypothetical protein